ncbi:MAG TPA: hypothetical protein VE130_06460 [Nitrososphaeraceae archaeon]|nr:hypothetical protein [Nitrososphaeraceae archaeon]
MVRHNIVYDLLMKRTRLSSDNMGIKSDHRIYFVICNSCYWCASYFIIDEKSSLIPNCNNCKAHDTEIIPISTDESFRIGHSQTRGIEVEFHKE